MKVWRFRSQKMSVVRPNTQNTTQLFVCDHFAMVHWKKISRRSKPLWMFVLETKWFSLSPISARLDWMIEEHHFCFCLLQEKVTDGPVSWASRNQVSFIAEQVSHHPPSEFSISLVLFRRKFIEIECRISKWHCIWQSLHWTSHWLDDRSLTYVVCFSVSAFYGEHYDKRISVDGYIWSKSKFLGLSIGVHMIGQGENGMEASWFLEWRENGPRLVFHHPKQFVNQQGRWSALRPRCH